MIDPKEEALSAIEKKVIRLRGTELFDYRIQNNSHPVVGEGSLTPSVVFIGEAPGRNEAKTGKPFCGAAGKILDQLLTEVQLTRKEVYITNIVKDRPPKNRDPLPSEIRLYAPFLDKQLEILEPKVIATLGRFSMAYILEKFGLEEEIRPISELHGLVFDAVASFGTIKILVLYHPAAGIYNQSLIQVQKKDIKQLNKYLNEKSDSRKTL